MRDCERVVYSFIGGMEFWMGIMLIYVWLLQPIIELLSGGLMCLWLSLFLFHVCWKDEMPRYSWMVILLWVAIFTFEKFVCVLVL